MEELDYDYLSDRTGDLVVHEQLNCSQVLNAAERQDLAQDTTLYSNTATHTFHPISHHVGVVGMREHLLDFVPAKKKCVVSDCKSVIVDG